MSDQIQPSMPPRSVTGNARTTTPTLHFPARPPVARGPSLPYRTALRRHRRRMGR